MTGVVLVTGRARRRAAGLAAAALSLACAGCARGQESRWAGEAQEMLPELARLAGLEIRAEPVVRETDAAALRAYLEARLEETYPGDLLDRMAAPYTWLGLLPDTLDLRALVLDLYTEQVLGYYDPSADILYVRRDAPGELLLPVLAHELVHALQDQHVDLDSIITDLSDNDRHTAAHAAIEGHATLVMFAWQMARETGGPVEIGELPDLGPALEEMTSAGHDAMPVLAGAPRIVQQWLVFPYARGVRYVQTLWQTEPERPAPFGPYLPISTEQVLHGRRAGPPVWVRSSVAPAGWQPVYENTLGELETRVLLERYLSDRSAAERAAIGWNGDHFRLLVGPEGRDTVFIWLTAWDSERDAGEFEAAYRRAAGRRFGAAPETEGREIVGPRGWARVDSIEIEGVAGRRIVEARSALAEDVRRALRLEAGPAEP